MNDSTLEGSSQLETLLPDMHDVGSIRLALLHRIITEVHIWIENVMCQTTW
jgi:hypothetical protein